MSWTMLQKKKRLSSWLYQSAKEDSLQRTRNRVSRSHFPAIMWMEIFAECAEGKLPLIGLILNDPWLTNPLRSKKMKSLLQNDQWHLSIVRKCGFGRSCKKRVIGTGKLERHVGQGGHTTASNHASVLCVCACVDVRVCVVSDLCKYGVYTVVEDKKKIMLRYAHFF